MNTSEKNEKKKENSEYLVTLNVGGFKHQILWSRLDKFPDTRLGRLKCAKDDSELKQLCDFYSLDKNEFYFDRDPTLFPAILGFYRNGQMHFTEYTCCPYMLDEELKYWNLDTRFIGNCCRIKLNERREYLFDEIKKENSILEELNKKQVAPFSSNRKEKNLESV